MDPQLVSGSIAVLAVSPLAAWIGAFGMLYAVQLTYPAPRPPGRSTRPTNLLLRAGSLAACLAWMLLLFAVR